MSESEPKKLFVYGTLRRDLGYRGAAEAGTPSGSGTISGEMYSTGAFPAVVPADEGRVRGQVLDFQALTDEEWHQTLKRMDRYEGVPTLFVRERTTVTLDDGTEEDTWVYFFASPSRYEWMPVVPSGDWADALSRGQA